MMLKSLPRHFDGRLNLNSLNRKRKEGICLECRLYHSVCMCPSPAPEQVVFIFGTQEFIHHISVPGEYEHSGYKSRGSSDRRPKNKMAISSKTAPTIVILFK